MNNPNKLSIFKDEFVTFVASNDVTDSVSCDVYSFVADSSKDLAIITVTKGCKTPLQKVLKGKMTLEGFLGGNGVLSITDSAGNGTKYVFPNPDGLTEVEVTLGQMMQWQADELTDLVFYEVCNPPFTDGRFEKIS